MIVGYNFIYNVRYDYDYTHDCESYGCNDEGICRCGKIEYERITSVDMDSMCNSVYNLYFNDDSVAGKRNNKINSIISDITEEIDRYTIDRILRISKVYDPNVWVINVINGYYGEEIGVIYINSTLALRIKSQLDLAFGITNLSERIEFLLKLEYGYVLPILEGQQFKIIDINKDSIIFGSESQYHKINTENLDHYDNRYKLIRGIVVPENNMYRLIDGYHRCYKADGVVRVITTL